MSVMHVKLLIDGWGFVINTLTWQRIKNSHILKEVN